MKAQTTRKPATTEDPYYIPHYRYLELKYYCLQYPIWEAAHKAVRDILNDHPEKLDLFTENAEGTPELRAINTVKSLSDRMGMIIGCAERAAEENTRLKDDLIVCVTKGKSFKSLNDETVTSREFSEAYHRFFYYLSKERN